MTKKVSIIIPNWNGRKLLEKNLPAVLATKPDEVIVVDDASPDDSNEFLKENYPRIKIVKHTKNLGFASACNLGVEEAGGEIVVLFNLDVVPGKEAIRRVLPHFKEENVFGVSFNEPNFSWARIFWKNGFVEHEPGARTAKTHLTAWVSGGSGAFRKKMWEELGGFDEIYKPFYWEDIDLSYRAWKRGWQVLWEPKAIVHHEHEAIIGKHFSKSYVDFISQRNRLIFIWKNITDLSMILEHKFWFIWHLKNPSFWRPALAAKSKLPWILPKKFKEWRGAKLADWEIFELFEE